MTWEGFFRQLADYIELAKSKPTPDQYRVIKNYHNPDGSVNYEKYMHSHAWARKRQKVLMRAGHRCQVCNSKGSSINPLHVHHRSYTNLGHEGLMDLIVMCQTCHKLFHDHSRIRA